MKTKIEDLTQIPEKKDIIPEVQNIITDAANMALVYSLAFEGAGEDVKKLKDASLSASQDLEEIHDDLMYVVDELSRLT